MAYSLKYSYDSTSQSYSVIGYTDITTSDNVVIPYVYDDGINGSYPVTRIGYKAFSGCNSLMSVVIGDSVTSIGEEAFSWCTELTSVVIGESVTDIGNRVFWGCNRLTSVIIGNSVTSIGDEAFRGCSNLTNIEIPNSVTSIGNSAFYNCDSLTSIEIPNNVTRIGWELFRYCDNLTSVVIGDGVKSISEYAFNGCGNLKQLILFPSSPPTLSTSAIPSTISKIYVQQSSKATYQATMNWKPFAGKIMSDNLYLSFIRFNKKNKEYINGLIANYIHKFTK